MKLFKALSYFVICIISVVNISAQNVVTFDDQNWNSDQSLSKSFNVGTYTFSSNEPFYTNYGFNLDVNDISIFYVFQNAAVDKIVLNTNGDPVKLISLAAYQVSEVSSDSLVIEGWIDSTLKYSRSFLNDSTWETFMLNYDNINKIVIRLDSAGSGGLTDYNFDNFTFEDSPLPVELTEFTARHNQNSVELIWKTATELNNYGFEVQRSVVSSQQSADSQNLNADSWNKIGFVEGSGNSSSPKNYSFVDSNPAGSIKSFYRIKQIDNDGEFKYSATIEVTIIPEVFTLSQNYPNPFNPATTIKYTLPVKGNVKLMIYNITGREVATLVDGFKEAGSYSVKFSARGGSAQGGIAANYSSGVYFYRLITSNVTLIKKMILLK